MMDPQRQKKPSLAGAAAALLLLCLLASGADGLKLFGSSGIMGGHHFKKARC